MTTRQPFVPPNQEYWERSLSRRQDTIIGFGRPEGPTTRAFQEVVREVIGESTPRKVSKVDPINETMTATGIDASRAARQLKPIKRKRKHESVKKKPKNDKIPDDALTPWLSTQP